MKQLGRLARAQQGYKRVADTELVEWGGRQHGGAGLDAGKGQQRSTALLSVQGMTCGACTSAVEAALSAAPGVYSARAALLQQSAEVEFDPSLTKPDALVSAVEDAGFEGGLVEVTRLTGGVTGDAAASGWDGGGGGGGAAPQVARLAVGGMTCAACSGAVERALSAVPGVRRAGVGLAQGEAEVVFDGDADEMGGRLVAAVEDIGFEARLLGVAGAEQCSLSVGGMTCAACSGAVERALLGVPGVARATVDLLGGRAQVWYDPNATGPRDFVSAVEACGFDAGPAPGGEGLGGDDAGAAQRAELDGWRRLLAWSLLFTAPLFVFAMLLPMLGVLPAGPSRTTVAGVPINQLAKWALATPVQFFVGWRFHKGAWKALRRGSANMDVLVSLGTNASYVYSLICVAQGRAARAAGGYLAAGDAADAAHAPTDFFETCAILITVVVLGKYLECGAKGRTSDAIKALLALSPESALLCQLDAEGHVVGTSEVATAMVHKGDFLKVLPGSRIPADGEVVEGSSYINESMITGESEPVLRSAGDPLIGGTLNAGSALLMRATKVGSDTVLSQIVRLVRRAQMSKAPIQAYADAVAAVFVPAVATLALITWLAWFMAGSLDAYPPEWLPAGHTHFLFALLFGIAVLVIACPCALGLATPTAVMVGTGVGASLGILIKGGDALERGSQVNTVIFDKTGTLTLGRPEVTDCRLLDARYSLRLVCELAAAAEEASEHPLARAVIEYAGHILSAPDGGAAASAAASLNVLTAGGSAAAAASGVASAAAAAAAPAGEVLAAPSGGAAATGSPNGSPLLRRTGGTVNSSGSFSSLNLNGIETAANGGSATNSNAVRAVGSGVEAAASGGSFLGPAGTTAWQAAVAAAGGGGGGSGSGSAMNGAGPLASGDSVSGKGSFGTPRRLARMVNGGAVRVADVTSHPGKGVTANVPWPAGLSASSAPAGGGGRAAAAHASASDGPGGGGGRRLSSDGAAAGGGGGGKQQPGTMHLAIGSRLLMQEQGVGNSPKAEAFMQGREDSGETCVIVALNRTPVAVMAIADTLKPEARGVVAALQRQGLECHLLTGDTWRAARAIGRQLGIRSVLAEVLPAGKAAVVQEQQALGRVVAMVGDGVNDSPALAAADAGMAIGSGTDIAVEAADYVLMRSSLDQVLIALDLSRATYRRIKLNFLWAMGYNTLMIPMAAGVLYPWFHVQLPPWVAGGCMVLSSISVVVSSLMLRHYKPPRLPPAPLRTVRVAR